MLFGKHRVKRFTRQLALLLEANVPMIKALELIAYQQPWVRWKMVELVLYQNRNTCWVDLILDVRANMREGEPLSQALSRHKVFDENYLTTIRWAESTGSSHNLHVALRLLADDTTHPSPSLARVAEVYEAGCQSD